MRWNLRTVALERGIATSTELRRRLTEAGMDISEGRMTALWIRTPTMVRLTDLGTICVVLDCTLEELLTPEPDQARPGPHPRAPKPTRGTAPIRRTLARNQTVTSSASAETAPDTNVAT